MSGWKRRLNYLIIFETAERGSCISSPPSRNEGEGPPEAILKMENCQTEVSKEEKKPLQKW